MSMLPLLSMLSSGLTGGQNLTGAGGGPGFAYTPNPMPFGLDSFNPPPKNGNPNFGAQLGGAPGSQQTAHTPGNLGSFGGNPILAKLFGGLGSNSPFYGNQGNMPSLPGLGALGPILAGLMHPQQQRTALPGVRQTPPTAPQPQKPGGLGGVDPRISPILQRLQGLY